MASKEKILMHPDYAVWRGMKARCCNPKATGYRRYGGAGVSVCDRWMRSFSDFIADMGPRPPNTSLDRFPNKHGNYEPGNCRWATPTQQQHNRVDNVNITVAGKTLPVKAWANELGTSHQALLYRLNHGWSQEKTIETPFQ